jgi:hypothetical protein
MDCLGIGELWGAIRHPEERIHGPGEAMLRRWDAMGRLRRVVGLAGLDAHARRLPLTWLRVFTYDYLFRTLRTHVMARPFVHRFEEDKAALREALEQGRCFMANDLPADATGFVFRGQKATGDPVLMGSETAWEPGFLLKVITPRHATLRLLCDGRIVCSKEGNYLAAPAERAGVYRAEAVLNGKPWIFSNPVYMR